MLEEIRQHGVDVPDFVKEGQKQGKPKLQAYGLPATGSTRTKPAGAHRQ